MHHFRYQRGALWAERVPLERLAREVGTPTYVYSASTLRRHYRVMDRALGGGEHLICYSVKANSSLAVLELLAKEGSGFDIVSGGELARALAAGADPRRIVYSGVGKTEAEMAQALAAGILMFNVESEQELELLERVARRKRVRAPVALRVNPAVDAKTHPHISTALTKSKFGIPLERAAGLYRARRGSRWLELVGVDGHIGSQMTQLGPLRQAVGKLAGLYRALLADGLPLRYLDVGGGLGITYVEEKPPSPAQYAKAIREGLGELPATLIVEPGRVIVGNAGLLLTRVLYQKRGEARRFLVVDAAMNDLIRPALYDARHELLPVKKKAGRRVAQDVVGPVCESADALARERPLPLLEPGALLAVMGAGAYGMSMASNYNSRLRPAEVMVEGSRYQVVRRRETYEDLLRLEKP